MFITSVLAFITYALMILVSVLCFIGIFSQHGIEQLFQLFVGWILVCAVVFGVGFGIDYTYGYTSASQTSVNEIKRMVKLYPDVQIKFISALENDHFSLHEEADIKQKMNEIDFKRAKQETVEEYLNDNR